MGSNPIARSFSAVPIPALVFFRPARGLHGEGRCFRVELGCVVAGDASALITSLRVDALTRTFAKEGKQANIYVNAIGPGLIVTQSNIDSMKPSQEDLQKKWVTMEQIIEAALFLVSSASDGVTGAILPVQGKGI